MVQAELVTQVVNNFMRTGDLGGPGGVLSSELPHNAFLTLAASRQLLILMARFGGWFANLSRAMRTWATSLTREFL